MTSAERIARLERALSQFGFQLHGSHSMANLRRQAPDLADLITEFLDGRQAANAAPVRRENTDAVIRTEER